MPKAKSVTTKRALLTSLCVDIIDVITNVVVAILTGSVVMIAEAMQGLADLTAVGLLLVGYKRSGKLPTKMYPFGFGKEAYFWSLLAAVVILVFTATMSFYFGLMDFLHPHPVESVFLAYAILLFAICTNGYAFALSARKLLEGRKWYNLPHEFMATGHIAPRTTLVLDALGMLAAFFGFIALVTYGVTGDGRFDGLGAMVIGILLACSSIILLIGVKEFITGRRAPEEIEQKIKSVAQKVQGVEAVVDLKTMMLGSENLLVNIEINFEDDLTTDQIERLIDRVKQKIMDAHPGRTFVQVEPETSKKKRS